MSGSSLDGLDIAFVRLEEIRGHWSFEILQAECLPYSNQWAFALKHATDAPVQDFLKLHTSYGAYLGEQINGFIERHQLHHQVQFIASHGHTVMHEPHSHCSFQIGDGASIAAITSLPVISDLRSLDVALGGQGAPIVPIGDKLLFDNYDYRLNIGGIANITVPNKQRVLAFDVCAANQILNTLANREGLEMDSNGALASSGKLLTDILDDLNNQHYYKQSAPKSLSNQKAMELVFPTLLQSSYTTADMLHTAVHLIVTQIVMAVKRYPSVAESATILVTGGGAFNTYLIAKLSEALAEINVTVIVPDEKTVKFKEALVMALIGTLRWREESNVLSDVTGAVRDSIGGALWMGHAFNG
jgi:anhydro-N-acetylmuramic acid kinase